MKFLTRQRCQRVSTLSALLLPTLRPNIAGYGCFTTLTPADSADALKAAPAVGCQRCHLRARIHQGFLPPPPSIFPSSSIRRNPLTPLTPARRGHFIGRCQ